MITKIIFLLLIYIALLAYDGAGLKRAAFRDRLVYGALLIPALYLSLLYAADKQWPNLDDLIRLLFAEPAKLIVETVKLPS